jgi:GTPase SAR1 family protein
MQDVTKNLYLLTLVDNTFWKTVYEKLRSNVFMKRIWTEHETSINEIIEQSLVDTYLRAVCHMYNIQRTFCNDQPKRNKLLVDKHKVVRGKKQHYGIPTEPRFIHYLPQEKTGYQLNVQLVGSGAVGKSTMIDTFLTGFPCDPILTPTFVSSANKTLMVGNTPVEMVIYDCHAMEDYGNLRKVAYPNIDLFLVIFCVSSPKSFEEVITTWIPEIRSVVANPLILLCGSKIDTRDDETVHDQLQKRGYKVIDKEEGEYMAKEFGCIGYVENSGITQVGLEETFSAVLRCGGANYADSKEFKQKKACRIT